MLITQEPSIGELIAVRSNGLLASAVALGHCVILNEVEQPCARQVGVVVGLEGGLVRTKYLCADPVLTPYNKKGCLNSLASVTPLADFGVEVRVDGDVYWCEVVGESRAIYADGERRQWQEYSGPIRQRFRKDVMVAIGRG